jgi:hypothetical protein
VWQAIKQIVNGTTLYYKQLNLFLVIGLVMVGGVFLRDQLFSSQLAPQAAVELPRSLTPKNSDPHSYAVAMDPSGKVTVNNKRLAQPFTFADGQAKFLLVLIPEAQEYVSFVRVRVQLPKPINIEAQLQPRSYGVHGVGAHSYRVIDNQTIEFAAEEIFEGATYSIELTFPEDYFAFGGLNKASSAFGNFSFAAWSLVALLFPILSGLFLLYLLIKRWFAAARVHNSEIVSVPPATLSPALVGALYHGKIGKKEITATLFDLARRGFLYMHYASDTHEVKFAKGQSLFTAEANTLRPFEVLLLHQIFGEGSFVSGDRRAVQSLDEELFSSRVAMILVNIYDAAVAEGYFVHSPNRYYLKYHVAGLIFFFISLAVLVLQAFTRAVPDFSLLAWVGMLVASLMIIWITPGLPPRAKAGDQTLRHWMSFRNYLADKRLVARARPSEEFFALLPYAIVFDCTDAWVSRWREEAITLPKWFSADEGLYRAEDYAQSLLSMVNYLSHQLISARPPDLA